MGGESHKCIHGLRRFTWANAKACQDSADVSIFLPFPLMHLSNHQMLSTEMGALSCKRKPDGGAILVPCCRCVCSR